MALLAAVPDLPQRCVVLWLDPGKVTGHASYVLPDGPFMSGELEFQDVGNQLEFMTSSYGQTLTLGWETFIVTPKSGPDAHYALEVIGVARWLGQKYSVELLPPVPASSRSLAGLQKLKRIGWFKPGKGHANDAAQHLLAWLIKTRQLPTETLRKAVGRE